MAVSEMNADGPAAAEDIVNLYTIFLGRAPEEEAVAGHLQTRVRTVADVVITSAEFAGRIHAVSAGAARTGADRTLSRDAVEWLQRRFGLNLVPTGATGALAALSALLKTDLHLWTTFRNRFGRRAPDLLAQLGRSPAPATTRWIGCIEVCSEALIQGWVQREPDTGPVRLALYINGMLLATTEATVFRQDVGDATGQSGICGFHLRPRLGTYLMRQPRLVLTLRDADTGQTIPLSGELTGFRDRDIAEHLDGVARGDPDGVSAAAPDDALVNFVRASAVPVERYAIFRALHRPPAPPPLPPDASPAISVVVLLSRGRRTVPAAIRSLRAQAYPRWQAVLVAGPGSAALAFDDPALHDTRTVVVAGGDEDDEAALRNIGLGAASGDYVCVVQEDDVLDAEALGWIAYAAHTTRARLLYTDDAAYEAVGDHRRLLVPRFKPAFDYDLLLATQYAVSPLVVARDDARAIGGFRSMPTRASDLDFLLRLLEYDDAIPVVHLPLALIDRPADAGGIAGDERGDLDAIDDVISEHFRRTAMPAVLAPPPAADFLDDRPAGRRVQWLSTRPDATLAIIIVTRNRVDLLQPCIESLRRTIAVPSRTEIIVVDHQSDAPLTVSYLASLERLPGVRVLSFQEEFNWSRANNLAAASTNADLLLFMNNDMEMITPAFDLVVRGVLDRPDVGVVGALLLYDDGSIQHAGTAVGVGGTAAHVGVGHTPGDAEGFDAHLATHGVAAVTGAFLGIRRTDFERVQGFDEAGLKVTFSDVDLCLKVRALGAHVIYTPAIRCFHYESATRGSDTGDPLRISRAERESALLASRWRHEILFDPFYNPSFCRDSPVHAAVRIPSARTVSAYLVRQTLWLERRRRRRILPGHPGSPLPDVPHRHGSAFDPHHGLADADSR